MRDRLFAGAVAGALSGAPSTAWALATGSDPLAPTLAAGSLLLPHETRRGRLLAAAVIVHTALSLGWAVALRPRTISQGVAAGLAIAALDLGVVGRRLPTIRDLPLGPQIADHIAYGVVLALAAPSRPGPRTGIRQRPG